MRGARHWRRLEGLAGASAASASLQQGLAPQRPPPTGRVARWALAAPHAAHQNKRLGSLISGLFLAYFSLSPRGVAV